MMSVFGLRRGFCVALLAAGASCLLAQSGLAQSGQEQPVSEKRIVELANIERVRAGLQPVQLDAGLAAAAHAHAIAMAAHGAIAHQYEGEADLMKRASAAGARFSVVEENIAFGPSPEQIHDGWMHSPGHHDNLLNPAINRIGVAVVSGPGGLYAVADYARGVESMTPEQIEAKVGTVLTGHGVKLADKTADARRYCALKQGEKAANADARFMMRWQSGEIEKMPPELEKALASGQFTQAAVGACEPQGDGRTAGAGFTAYRVAVLLY